MRSIEWAIVALCVLLCVASAAPADTITIVVTGQGAPDANGTFGVLSNVMLNDSGQAAFKTRLIGTSGGTADDYGIFRGSGGTITQIVREGQVPPDSNGTYSQLNPPALNDSGHAAFYANLTGTSGWPTDTAGIFRGSGGTVSQIVRAGQGAPDGNGTFSSFNEPELNDLGQAAFHATLTGTSSGSSDNSGIFRGSGGTITRIAREGQGSPDGNGTFSGFDIPALNDSGQAAFWSYLSGTSGGSSGNTGIFRGSGGTITQIARAGQGSPDGNGTFLDFGYHCVLNDSGRVVFLAVLTATSGGTSDNIGIYRGSGETITQIAREGQPAPDGNGVYYNFRDMALNASGQVAFHSSLTATSGGYTDDSGIFRGSGGTITQIVREGQDAPDGNGTLATFAASALNGSGHVAFRAGLGDTSGGSSDDAGIYISDGIDLIQVARKNQAFSGSTIKGLTFANGADERNGLNDFGQVAYMLHLLDDRYMVAVFTPEVHWRTGGSGYWYYTANWTLGIAPAALYDVLIDPVGSLNVTGHYLNTTVKSLTVGSTGDGVAALHLNNGGDLSAVGAVTVTSGGKIEVGVGRVLSAASLTNSGVLTGSGTVQAPLSNETTGEVRVSGGQRMVFAGSGHVNAGKVEVIGGEIEFTGDLTNAASTGLITGSSATLRFTGGLTNNGSVALSFGRDFISGEIDNTASGGIIVSGNSEATFYDDVSNAGVIQVSGGSTAVFFGDLSGNGCTGAGDVFLEGDTRPGFSPGEMSFGGNVVFGPFASLEIELGGTLGGDQYDRLAVAGDLTPGGTLQVVLIDGFAPDVGDTFDILDWGTVAGAEFDSIELPGLLGRKVWDSSDLYSTGEISIIGMLAGDTDVDWDVDDADYDNLVAAFGSEGGWQTDFNEDGRTDLIDFALQRGNFGFGVGSSPSGELGAATPEPITVSILALGGLAVIRRRRLARGLNRKSGTRHLRRV